MPQNHNNFSLNAHTSGWQVLLDGVPVKTPLKHILILPNEQLAKAILDEFQQQGKSIQPHKMPLFQLANSAIDRVAPNIDKALEQTGQYIEFDLLYYWANDQKLAQKQQQIWQPILDWAKISFGLEFTTTNALVPSLQPQEMIDIMLAQCRALSVFELTAFITLCHLYRSAILALAVVKKHLSGLNAFKASQIDTYHQIEQWGDDQELLDNLANITQEVNHATDFLSLLYQTTKRA